MKITLDISDETLARVNKMYPFARLEQKIEIMASMLSVIVDARYNAGIVELKRIEDEFVNGNNDGAEPDGLLRGKQ